MYSVNGRATCNPCARPYIPGLHTDYPAMQESVSVFEIPSKIIERIKTNTTHCMECNDCGTPEITRE